MGSGAIEARLPVERPLDVLAQHLVTVALGGGFVGEEVLAGGRGTAPLAGGGRARRAGAEALRLGGPRGGRGGVGRRFRELGGRVAAVVPRVRATRAGE